MAELTVVLSSDINLPLKKKPKMLCFLCILHSKRDGGCCDPLSSFSCPIFKLPKQLLQVLIKE